MLNVDLRIKRIEPKLGDIISVVEDKRENMCDCCFFGEMGLDLCNHVKCNLPERETKDSVSFQEVKRERRSIKDLEPDKEYNIGDVVRYFKGSLYYPKYAKVVETNKCKGCILVGECVCVVCGEKQRSDGKSIALLPCNEKGELI